MAAAHGRQRSSRRAVRFAWRLKIDRRFVGGVTTNSDDATIVRVVIGLARALGVEVVAEGVETAEQRAFLTAAGCQVAQGYYFGKPMPADAATALLRRKAPAQADAS
jgi:EAL domain-containing protein (putative c-di-GMP-specific phosphodiesterase class I)